MLATRLDPAEVPADTWSQRIDAITDYVDAHHGRFPNQHAVDPDEALLGVWWAWAQTDAGSNSQRHDLDALRRRATELRLAALTDYVRAHDGRFPPNRSEDPEVASLGCWWVAQNIELTQEKMDDWLVARLDQLRRDAAELVAAEKQRRAADAAEASRRRARAATLAAGAAGAVAAAEALKSPYLIPGDAEVLQLRIDHPTKSLAQLADLMGLPVGRFSTKYYGALHRGPHSRSPLRKELPDRTFAPAAAADLVGVPRVILARWSDAGLLAVSRNNQGHRRYIGSELLRVKELISEGWPQEFLDAAQRRGR